MAKKDPRFQQSLTNSSINSAATDRTESKIVGKEIANSSILTNHLANDAVTSDKISNGAVTPKKLSSNWPVFYAWAAGGQSNSVTGRFGDSGLPIFDQIRVNSGNYSTTTGRFTAPYTGIYEFHFAVIHRYGTGAGSLELTFYIDQQNASPRAFSYSQVGYSGDHDWVHTHAILSLNAGQYVQCGIYACSSTTNYYYGENLGYFSGKQIR